MIHYHGLPITPETAAVAAISGGHAFVSVRDARNLALVIDVCQSFAVDNGAFSAWRAKGSVTDWSPFYRWVEKVLRNPSCDFVVIPDSIDGDEAANDALLADWPFGSAGAPVWHLHESLLRLDRLVSSFSRVALGSSQEYAVVGTAHWWKRMHDVMRVACDEDGYPRAKLHGLRMLNPAVFAKLPLASADSTNIARNVNIDQKWRGTYTPPTKEARAAVMRHRIEAVNAPSKWTTKLEEEYLCSL